MITPRILFSLADTGHTRLAGRPLPDRRGQLLRALRSAVRITSAAGRTNAAEAVPLRIVSDAEPGFLSGTEPRLLPGTEPGLLPGTEPRLLPGT